MREFTALAEVPGSIPSTHIRQITTTCNSRSRGLMPSGLQGTCLHMVHRNSHRHTYIHTDKNVNLGWVWWHTPLIPALRRQRQVDLRVPGQSGYTGRPCLKL